MEWPLVGRESTLRRLTATLDGHAPSSVTIAGEEGVGKTRLAAEVAKVAQARGHAVERISASHSTAPIPFGAVAPLLAMPANSADLSVLMGKLLAELQQRSRDGGQLVLLVDDAHQLDEHSATLLHQAAAHRVASILLTTRSGEPAPAVLTQLWKDRHAQRVEIGPLNQGATRRLIQAALGGPVDGLTQSELWQRSGGNPLFLRELILAGLESETLARAGDVWRLVGPLAPSSRLSELVRSRLGTLRAGERTVVDVLAVADVVDLETLQDVAGETAVEALEERNLIVAVQSGNRTVVRFAHPIYGEVVSAAMPRARARRVMRELAARLDRTGARRHDDLLKLALWGIDGGSPPDPDLLLAAARRALATFDAPLAERLARAALATDGDRVSAELLLGEALAAQQRVEEADEILERAADHARHDDEVAQVALAWANTLYFRAGRTDDAARVLGRALDRVKDPGWRDELQSLAVLFKAAAGELHAVAAAGRHVLERDGAPARAVVHTLTYSTIANVMLGRFADAEAQVRLGLELAPETAEVLPLSGEMLRINGVMANAYAGRHRQALELATAGQRSALGSRVAEVSAMWSMNLADCQMLSGDIEASLHSMLECLAVVRERDPFAVRGIACAFAAVCATWLGRHDLARELRQEVIDLELARDVRSRIWLDRASAWAAWHDEGAEAGALACMRAARQAISYTHLVWAAGLFHDAARLGMAGPAATRLDALARRVEGELVPAMALHAHSLAASDGLALERAASAFERLGSNLFAAEAAAKAQQAYMRDGRPRLARVVAARAALLAAQCPNVKTPGLADVAPVPLTRRELEVARLAADGLSSRELGERLRISVRTVDNHLTTVYGKLGISSRAELPDVLGVAMATAAD